MNEECPPAEYAGLLSSAREIVITNGSVDVPYESLRAGWLSIGFTARLSNDLGLPWRRDDKRGVMVFQR